MRRTRGLSAVVGSVLATLLVSCSSSASTGTPAGSGASTTASVTSSVDPQTMLKEQGASRLRPLLEAFQNARDRVVVRADSPFADWHRAAVVYAQTCHSLVAELGKPGWPIFAQSDVDFYVASLREDCAAWDSIVPARTLAEYQSATRRAHFANREFEAQAKHGLLVSLGLEVTGI